jgi:hypothetical protein
MTKFADQSPEEIQADAKVNSQILRDAKIAAEAASTHPSRWYFGISEREPNRQDKSGSSEC